MQSWCRTWPPNGSSRIRAKQKLLRKHKGACKSSWIQIGNRKSFTLTIPWNFRQSLWRSFLESLYVDTTQVGNKWCCWESSTESERRHLCSVVAIRSGWKLVGRFYGMLLLSAKPSRSLVWWERHPMKGDSEYHSKDQWFRLAWSSNITLFLPKTCRDCISSLHAGGIWEGDITVADSEELEEMDASELHARRLNAKEVFTPMSGEKFIFASADGTVKLSAGDQVLRTSTSIWDRPDRGEEQGNPQGESDGSSSTPLRDSSRDDGTGDYIYHLHVEPRVKLNVQTEKSSPFHWNISNLTRATSTSRNVMPENSIEDYWTHTSLNGKHIDDYWNVDGDRELSDTWRGFTRFTFFERKTPDGCAWSGRRLTRK